MSKRKECPTNSSQGPFKNAMKPTPEFVIIAWDVDKKKKYVFPPLKHADDLIEHLWSLVMMICKDRKCSPQVLASEIILNKNIKTDKELKNELFYHFINLIFECNSTNESGSAYVSKQVFARDKHIPFLKTVFINKLLVL